VTSPSARVSVIIPIYNVEEYLEQCLESVAAQSYQDVEILCVIDGATDGSMAIAQRFAQREPRCRVIEQPNSGLSVARNTGVKEARGDWVFFLDSDDWMPPNALQMLVQAAGASRSVVVSGAITEYCEEREIFKPYIKPEKRALGHLHLYQQNFFAVESTASNKLYPSEWIKECPFVPGLVHEDLDFYWRFFSAHPQVLAISDTVIYYRRRSGSLSWQKVYDEHYQNHYIHIADTAFRAASLHRPLRYHARRQSLKYLKYLKERNAPCARYVAHIETHHGVHDSAVYRGLIKVKSWLNI
jgi:glycosyltransferase involved in cell wall biosynthesis